MTDLAVRRRRRRRLSEAAMLRALPDLPRRMRRRAAIGASRLPRRLRRAVAAARRHTDAGLCRRWQLDGWENLHTSSAEGTLGYGRLLLVTPFGYWPLTLLAAALYCRPLMFAGDLTAVPGFIRQRLAAARPDPVPPITLASRTGTHVLVTADPDAGDGSTRTRFLDRVASPSERPAQLSLATNSPIVPLYVWPRGRPAGELVIRAGEAIVPSSSESVSDLTIRWVRDLEAMILAHPAFWPWSER
ncbi:MAG: hypothetical protein AAGD38_04105 [Acidobacteriota bacterium]